MSNTCKICRHEKRDEIDKAIIVGEPLRGIAKKYGVSDSSVSRHKKDGHIAKELLEAEICSSKTKAVSLYDSFEAIREKVEGVIRDAEDNKNPMVVLQGLRELRELFKLRVQMKAMQLEGNVNIDPVALVIDIRDYLSENYSNANKGLLKHLQDKYEQYRARISQGE